MSKREYIIANRKWLEDKAKEEDVNALPNGNYSAPYYMISCLAVVLQQGMRCISNFRSS